LLGHVVVTLGLCKVPVVDRLVEGNPRIRRLHRRHLRLLAELLVVATELRKHLAGRAPDTEMIDQPLFLVPGQIELVEGIRRIRIE
jgi:hypothetical protein